MIAWMQADLFDRIGRGFRGYLERPEAPVAVLILVVLLVILGLILHALFSRRGRGRRQARRRYRRFAQASGLSPAESELLLDAAQAAGLEDPAVIFFRRSAFEDVARRPGATPDRLDALRGKVYGP